MDPPHQTGYSIGAQNPAQKSLASSQKKKKKRLLLPPMPVEGKDKKLLQTNKVVLTDTEKNNIQSKSKVEIKNDDDDDDKKSSASKSGT